MQMPETANGAKASEKQEQPRRADLELVDKSKYMHTIIRLPLNQYQKVQGSIPGSNPVQLSWLVHWLYINLSDEAPSVALWLGRLTLNLWVRGSSLRRGNIKMDITQAIFQHQSD